jgi:SAM-dependent methyltransferase
MVVQASAITTLKSAEPFRDYWRVLECPLTGEPFTVNPDGSATSASGRRYDAEGGIPKLFLPLDPHLSPSDITEMVKAFYEETPFPNYDDLASRDSLVASARHNAFARALDEQLPAGAVVLEAGCGTGQLTNFLGMAWDRRVFGGDVCMNSLRLAKGFRDRFRVMNATFVQMNLFRPPFRNESVDVLISNGVLHHTADPEGGFKALLRKVKPNGLVLIGLYNSLGRLPTLWRRWIFEHSGSAFHFFDRRLTSGKMNDGRWKAWFRDQYQHPHESRHSINEVLRWFDESNVTFLSSVPAADGATCSSDTPLFEPRPPGSALIHIAAELEMLLTGGRDGGLFIMIGRKRA